MSSKFQLEVWCTENGRGEVRGLCVEIKVSKCGAAAEFEAEAIGREIRVWQALVTCFVLLQWLAIKDQTGLDISYQGQVFHSPARQIFGFAN